MQQRDYMQLQADLDTVWEWARVWQMDFNVAKCKVMHMGTRGVGYDYCMGGRRLEVVDQERDLGVLISNSLKVAGECQQAYAKANKMLGLVARVIRHKDMNMMLRLYKTLVRPHLEYASAAWSPHYAKDKKLLERVQHRFTRMFEELKDMEYAARLVILRLWSLEERRNRADLIELFRMARRVFPVCPRKPSLRELPLTEHVDIAASCRRCDAVVTCASIFLSEGRGLMESASGQCGAGTDCKCLQKMDSNVCGNNRWASLWTHSPLSPMAAEMVEKRCPFDLSWFRRLERPSLVRDLVRDVISSFSSLMIRGDSSSGPVDLLTSILDRPNKLLKY